MAQLRWASKHLGQMLILITSKKRWDIIVGSCGHSTFDLENFYPDFHSGHTNLGLQFSFILTSILLFFILLIAILTEVRPNFNVVMIGISMMAKDVKQFFHIILSHL